MLGVLVALGRPDGPGLALITAVVVAIELSVVVLLVEAARRAPRARMWGPTLLAAATSLIVGTELVAWLGGDAGGLAVPATSIAALGYVAALWAYGRPLVTRIGGAARLGDVVWLALAVVVPWWRLLGTTTVWEAVRPNDRTVLVLSVVVGLGWVALHDPDPSGVGPRSASRWGPRPLTWAPLLGWMASVALTPRFTAADRWLAGGLVVALGARLVADARFGSRRAGSPRRGLGGEPELGGLAPSALVAKLGAGASPAAVLLVELDRRRSVRDSIGLTAGEDLLSRVALRLRSAVGEGWEVIRLSGDEFACVTDMAIDRDDLDRIGRYLVEFVHRPFELGDSELWLAVSIGGATTEDGVVGAALVDSAEQALRAAKAGSGPVVVADERVRQSDRTRVGLQNALRGAVERDELFCTYQPKVDLATGALVGVEALVRWRRPGQGVVAPDEFIPVAEAAGLIAAIDEWVFADALRNLDRWNRLRPFPRLELSTNMSAWQLARADVHEQVARAIARQGGVDPGQVTIEITETALVDEPSIVALRLERLQRVGVRVSVDDFGAGFTSIAHLRRFPISEVKIDRSLVSEAQLAIGSDTSVIAAVMALARSLDLDVVAEGVEKPAQAEALRLLGCRVAQGYLFARPLPPAEIDRLVTAEEPFGHLLRRSGHGFAGDSVGVGSDGDDQVRSRGKVMP
ncbi:MAG: putative bifunctional diguanylate cyclase/phosphodiesterase [Acidimicrobiales bacterium]